MNYLNSKFASRIVEFLSKSCEDNRTENFPESTFLDSGIYIYGAGDLGQLAIEYCEFNKIKILGVLDQTREGLIHGRLSSYKIYRPHEVSILSRQKHSIFVAVATAPYLPIVKILSSHQWLNIFPFYSMTALTKDAHPLTNGWLVGKIDEFELKEVRWICDNLNDIISLSHYEAFLAWHTNYSELSVEDGTINPNLRYTIEPLVSRLSKHKNQMIDVGSHEGESVKRLLDAGIRFNEYILIEPDGNSRKKLRNNVQTYLSSLSKVYYKDEVISSQNRLMAFEEGLGYCSQLWSKSKNIKSTITLDSLNLMPDFIKIHTEGSELDILKGASKTISNCKPSLAYSVYHNRDGVCKAIIEPMKNFENYRWYFRLHSYQGTGAFVYGIPN